MTQIFVLDTGPLGEVTDNPHKARVRVALARLHELGTGARLVIPEIADYELRRELLRTAATRSIHRLNDLKTMFLYDPITTDAMLLAAQFWADSRRRGMPTADPHALDGDAILAAQATLLASPGARVTVLTTNVGHLAQFVDARDWETIG